VRRININLLLARFAQLSALLAKTLAGLNLRATVEPGALSAVPSAAWAIFNGTWAMMVAAPTRLSQPLTIFLVRSMRAEADLIDQLFNPREKRLARILLLLAAFGKPVNHASAGSGLEVSPSFVATSTSSNTAV
jgi:hypothetical protein